MVEEEVNQEVAPQDPPSRVLWSTLKAKGFPADYETFASDMSDSKNRALLYQKVKSKGLFTKGENDFNAFFSDIDVKKKNLRLLYHQICKAIRSLFHLPKIVFLTHTPK